WHVERAVAERREHRLWRRVAAERGRRQLALSRPPAVRAELTHCLFQVLHGLADVDELAVVVRRRCRACSGGPENRRRQDGTEQDTGRTLPHRHSDLPRRQPQSSDPVACGPSTPPSGGGSPRKTPRSGGNEPPRVARSGRCRATMPSCSPATETANVQPPSCG